MAQSRPTPEPGAVLVVDDDKAARTLVRLVLEKAGLKVVEADSGEEGLAVLTARAAVLDAVVLDVRMPGLSGFEVLKVIQDDAYFSRIPVLVLTAHADTEEDVVRSALLGAVDHLGKPFSPAVLQAKVVRAVRRRREQRELEGRVSAAERLARIDALTQLGNRQLFYERFREEAAFAARSRSPLALAVLDLDHFKSYNDTLGHDAGDLALQHFSGTMTSSIRREDSAFRYGGEEFVLLMRGADRRSAKACTTRLRAALKQSPVVLTDGSTRQITFSGGIAVADESNEFWTEGMFGRADEALYRAKESGRDRDELA